jgi:hypothetical protein
MYQEQSILQAQIHSMVSYLTATAPSWPLLAVPDVRIAVTTTDMGLSANGEPYDPQWGFPMGLIGPQCSAPLGDNGALVDPDEAESLTECPALSASDDGWYAVEELQDPQVLSCLVSPGTSGCGFEQQLQAGAVSIEKQGALGNLRDDALLAVIVISDEEDCSVADPHALYTSDEVQKNNFAAVNVACGENPDSLISIESLRTRMLAAKNGNVDAVFFGAIVGVPQGGFCEGSGADLSLCLDHPKMQPTIIMDTAFTVGEKYIYDYACERRVDDIPVTQASPGIRMVQMARSFGENAWVSSICNTYWHDAIVNLSARIAARIEP